MTVLCKPQPPPAITLCIKAKDNVTDDARLALQEIHSYLTELNLAFKVISGSEKDQYRYEIEGDLIGQQKTMILEIIGFLTQGHWSIKEEGSLCQEHS